MEPAVRRFACTQCGQCCNRSPEMQLSETMALADVFVFRLMFRLYWLPRQLGDYLAPGRAEANASAIFHQRKRLLGAFAARKYPVKVRRGGKAVEYTKYLLLSALALDTRPGACSALDGRQCGIHHRRPLSCRSVPFHYSHAEALAESGLMAFVATDGYCCDTSEAAEVVLKDGRIVAPEIRAARSEAIAVAEGDRRWGEAIARRMNAAAGASPSLPSLEDVEANAHFGATTTSMRAAWQIAADAGLLAAEQCETLARLQLSAIDQALAAGGCPRDVSETLVGMRAEYLHQLNAGRAIVAAS